MAFFCVDNDQNYQTAKTPQTPQPKLALNICNFVTEKSFMFKWRIAVGFT